MIRSMMPASQRLFRLDRIPFGAHLHGLGYSRKTGETLRPSGAGNNAEFYLGLANLSAGRGDAIMPCHRKLQATAERRTMNRHHDGLAAIFDLKQQRQQSRAARALAGGELSELLDICAGYERATSADEHSRANRAILANLLDSFGNALRDTGAEGVYGRIIDGDDCYVAVFGELDEIAHRNSPFLSSS